MTEPEEKPKTAQQVEVPVKAMTVKEFTEAVESMEAIDPLEAERILGVVRDQPLLPYQPLR